MLKNKIKNLLVAAVMLVTSAMPTFADVIPVQVIASDAVAGYPAAFKTSLIEPNKNVRFVIEKPDGAIVQIPAQADLDGIARTDFYGHQTKVAGDYEVAVVYPGTDNASPQTNFTVYPDAVSGSQSTVRATLPLVEAKHDASFVVVTLYDQYRNPIPNHLVQLISSRSDDSIEALQNGVTDQNGRANFKVKSEFPGLSVYSALDITANQVLSGREEVVYTVPSTPLASNLFGASLFAAEIGQGESVLPGPVDSFEIEGLASQVKVGEQLSVTITAKDANGNVAKNYTGSILFSVPDDENAVLPANGEYTFKASDQGSFTFDLSLQFSKLGNQVLQVFDKNNFKLAGEFPVEVISASGIPVSTTSSLSIKSPADGSELGSSLVILTGQGNENINLKIFDNDVKIGDSETDGDGFFSFEVKNLTSGSHSFYVMSEGGDVSKPVTVLIDTLPPVVNEFEIFPDGISLPGDQLTIIVQSEPNLETANVRIQGVEQPLAEVSPGTYETTVSAPVTDGSFPVDVILIDALANKGELRGQGTINVQTPAPTLPPKVEGLDVVVGDGSISLEWQAVEGHEGAIDQYRVFVGSTFDNLDQTFDTTEPVTVYEIDGLENDKQVFVAVKAVDSQGLESEEFSTIVAATPVAPVVEPEPVEPDPVPVVNPGSLSASPLSGAVQLTWTPFGVPASNYQIFFGIAPGQYSDFIVTPDNRTAHIVNDLIDGLPYYFAVVPLNVTGQAISALSAEVQAAPGGVGFRPSAPSPIADQPEPTAPVILQDTLDETGPEALWIIIASMFFAFILYRHKRNVILNTTR